jgi:hypothetical protein
MAAMPAAQSSFAQGFNLLIGLQKADVLKVKPKKGKAIALQWHGFSPRNPLDSAKLHRLGFRACQGFRG